MHLIRDALAAIILAGLVTGAGAQGYPAKPIKLIVPAGPGGGTDMFSRVVVDKLTETLKWVILVDNRPGAGGNLGIEVAVKSPADGYTIVMGQTSNLAVNPTLFPKLTYAPLKDLVPIILVASAPLVMVVASNSQYKSLADVIAASRGKPDKLTFASPGNGTVSHLSGELIQQIAGVKLVHVPYKGSPQAIIDLMGGRVDVFMSSVASSIGQIKGGKISALVVTSAKRSAVLPAVPTVAESGYPGFEADTWFGLLAPAGTPAAIVLRLNAEVNKVLSIPDVRAKMGTDGGEALGGSPEKFGALLKSDIARWGKVVRDSGAKVD